MNMSYSKNGVDLTQQFEGCEYKAYRDVGGVWTIGYGHVRGVKEGDTCDAALAYKFLLGDIGLVADQINRDLTVPVNQAQFDALVDFGFNLGCHALESSTLWKLLNAQDYAGAAAQFPKWSYAGGKYIEGLHRRRLAEQKMFES